jgi:hypothetical protein
MTAIRREINCTRDIHEFAKPTRWLGLNGAKKAGSFCVDCGKWVLLVSPINRHGEKGGKVGELLVNEFKSRFPGKLVTVHHFTNYSAGVQLEVEIRNPDHSDPFFTRIVL